MILNLEIFRDKLAGCWAGKNIGGVLGEPFEAIRQINDVDFYTQDLSMGPPPNDDLDLQLIWLSAVEKYGRNVNASILGEYWISYIIQNWMEYGTAKSNLRAGLVPPICGELDNTYKNSNGSFIRSEVWACLAPGHPEIATRYAYEDAIVDHAGEGMYGEIFFAALESAAFVESNYRTLIDIGLSYIPEDCVTAKVIKKAIECYENKVDFFEARKIIHNMAPGTFGIMYTKLADIKKEGNEGLELGEPGFDAPENVGFTILGWLYGEDDFGKSLVLANSCGEDADCTCATLGAIMGIIRGASGLPEKWTKPLNDRIETKCILKVTGGVWIPKTATELAERVLRNVPGFLGQDLCDAFAEGGMTIQCNEGKELFCKKEPEYMMGICGGHKDHSVTTQELCALSPYQVHYEFPAFRVVVDYMGSVYYKKGKNRKVRVKVFNRNTMNHQLFTKITAYVPEGIQVCGSTSVELPLNNLVGSYAETEFELSTEMYTGGRLEFIIDVALVGRHSSGPIKVTLLSKN